MLMSALSCVNFNCSSLRLTWSCIFCNLVNSSRANVALTASVCESCLSASYLLTRSVSLLFLILSSSILLFISASESTSGAPGAPVGTSKRWRICSLLESPEVIVFLVEFGQLPLGCNTGWVVAFPHDPLGVVELFGR